MKPIATTLQGARSTFSIFTNIPTPRAETTSLSIRDLAHKTCCCILKWQKQSRGEFAGTAIIGSRTEGLFYLRLQSTSPILTKNVAYVAGERRKSKGGCFFVLFHFLLWNSHVHETDWAEVGSQFVF